MNNLRILNSKEKKKIIEQVKNYFGIENLELDYIFLMSDERKVYLVSEDAARVELDMLRVNSLGLYFGAFEDNFRLSIEWAQLIGRKAKKNVVELNDDTKWLEGNDIEVSGENGLKIVKCKNDFLGTGQLKNGTLINYVSKERRIK